MNLALDNAHEFVAALREVETLIVSAEKCEEEDEESYATFNKAAILLLAGKFENFAETLAEDYVGLINELQLRPNLIPKSLRLRHTLHVLRNIETLKSKGKYTEAINVFTGLSVLWGTNAESVALSINCKFAYGKHGEKELIKLFANIGIEDIFEEIKIYKSEESLFGDEVKLIEIDFKGMFNSVTGIRNNILHQDHTPNLTSDEIRGYKQAFELFAMSLATFLNTARLR